MKIFMAIWAIILMAGVAHAQSRQELCDQYLDARGWEAQARAMERMSQRELSWCMEQEVLLDIADMSSDPVTDWMDENPGLSLILLLAYLAAAAHRTFPATRIALKNEMGHVVMTPRPGRFSWTVLLFNFFPPLFRGHWQASLIMLACALFTLGLASLAFAFFYNQWFVARMVDRGYRIKEGMPMPKQKPHAGE